MIWKAREAARKIPGGSGSTQAARNTGPVIRIAMAMGREKLVISGLLADKEARIKRLLLDSVTS